jgi:NADPH:quinone reductase
MNAVVLDHIGGPEALVVRDLPVPQPSTENAVLAMHLAGLNFIDIYQRRGKYPVPPGTILGIEGVGRDIADGLRYAFFDHLGAYAEYVSVPRDRLVPLPDDVRDEDALALFQGITAQYLTESVHPLRAGETVLVTAAAGGVGRFLLAYVKAAGARAIGIVSHEEKADAVRAQGATPLVAATDFANDVRALVPNGVDVAFDANGASTWEATFASVRRRGHIVVFGSAGPPIPPIDVDMLRSSGSLTVTYPSFSDYVADSVEREDRIKRFFEALRAGRFADAPLTTFPLTRAADAHTFLESRRSIGKVALTTN